jgi:NADPH2:quinone reductase
LLWPGGAVTAIDDPHGLDLLPLKAKSISFHWEFMFTRPLFGTADMVEQHRLLNEVADLVDAGRIQTTATTELGPIDAQTLREAHRQVESARTIGKVVIAA